MLDRVRARIAATACAKMAGSFHPGATPGRCRLCSQPSPSLTTQMLEPGRATGSVLAMIVVTPSGTACDGGGEPITSRSTCPCKSARVTVPPPARGVQVAAEVVSKAQFLQGYKFDQVLEGEIARRIDHNSQVQAKYGVARIFKTSASATQIADAMADPPDVFAVPGRVRTFVVQLADGRVGGFSSFDSKETADRVSEEIKRVRANQSSQMSKLAPDGMAEQFGGRIFKSSGT